MTDEHKPTTTTGGSSRASKKRAKKRAKQKQNECIKQTQTSKELDTTTPNVGTTPDTNVHMDIGGDGCPTVDLSDGKSEVAIEELVDQNGYTTKPKSKKKKKRQNETKPDSKTKKNKRTHKDDGNTEIDPIIDGNDNDSDGDGDGEEEVDDEQDEEILIEQLSELPPIEILYPERYAASSSASTDDSPPQPPTPHEILQTLSSKLRSRILFHSIIRPSGITPKVFYEEYWEKKPLLISKSDNKALDQNQKQEDEDHENNNTGRRLTAQQKRQEIIRKHQEETIRKYREETGTAPTRSRSKTDAEEETKRYRTRFHGLLSKKDIECLLSQNAMRYGKDLNVTNYCRPNNGTGLKRRITLDKLSPSSSDTNTTITTNKQPNGDDTHIIASPTDVRSSFSNDGCTIRLLCPQKHNDVVHSLLSTLEDSFGCMVGSNAYLTPAHSPNQGFAPHYDDIEAFVLQLEGRKRWRVYKPMGKGEELPRRSSRDFSEKGDKEKMGDPVMDVELGPGDLLYMPRGWIHQAITVRKRIGSGEGEEKDSLHLTVSAMQNWSWADLLELVVPNALEAVAESDTTSALRAGLPRGFLDYMGMMHEENEEEIPEGLRQISEKMKRDDTNERMDGRDREAKRKRKLQNAFHSEAKKKLMRVFKQALTMITPSCDEMGKRHMSDRLPPSFTPIEASFTQENRLENGGKIWPNTLVRLARPGIARLVVEDAEVEGDGKKVVLYHSVDNSRVYHEQALSPMEFEIDDAPALETLLTTVEPHWVCVRDLIHGDIEDKMDIAQSLFDEGILAIFQEDSPDATIQTG